MAEIKNDKLLEQATLVYTRCVFFRHEDTTILENQVNFFLTYAPLSRLQRTETTAVGEAVVVTLWFDPMPDAFGLEQVYERALEMGKPAGSTLADILDDEDF